MIQTQDATVHLLRDVVLCGQTAKYIRKRRKRAEEKEEEKKNSIIFIWFQ